MPSHIEPGPSRPPASSSTASTPLTPSTPSTTHRGGSHLYDVLAKALSHQYPESYGTAEALRSLDWSKLEGLQRGTQGGWFEVAVGDALDRGDLALPADAAGWGFPAAGTAGYDIEFLSGSNEVIRVVQLKATTSLGYIRRTLERYPDIPIIATSEVARQAQEAGLGEMVLDSGISISEFPGMDPMKLGFADFNPLTDDFNIDFELLDAAIIAMDILARDLHGQ